MNREEAINVVRNIYQTDKEKEALSILIPELSESDDERVRKGLINFLQSPFIKENLTDEKVAPWIAYLEKQKGQKPAEQNNATINGEPIPTENQSANILLPEWSEEDETRLTNILIMLKEYVIHHYSKDDVNKSVDWLKSLPERFNPQPKVEWSEEDKTTIKEICDFLYETSIGVYRSIGQDTFKRWIDCLKSL